MKPSKVIVGLGNPGSKYKDTRHNVGYMVLAELAARHASGKPVNQFHAECLDVKIAGQNVLLMIPTTFMNLSGVSVSEVVRFYKLNPKTDIFVVCDDLDLPVAKIRIRESAGSGGQKGLKDVIARLGTQDFARARIGIGRPSSTDQVVDFVLTQFRKDERADVEIAVKNVADAAQIWVERGCAEAMNRFNVDDKKKRVKGEDL
ncbi:MAG: aminoacyl-tRNA hydrolase [Thermoguttaceae bacterium]|nr:aminoacyl-tRNA hydrolase [Thermoguttaceae bacterium]MBR5757956.1 aminoacyl-tRNA hydrolase [Thermoguttaceae bacterium]